MACNYETFDEYKIEFYYNWLQTRKTKNGICEILKEKLLAEGRVYIPST